MKAVPGNVRNGLARWPPLRPAIGPLLCLVALAPWGKAAAAESHGGVRDTPHNLSVTGPGEVKSLEETEICKFCHIPHNAEVPAQLWSRELPDSEYRTPSILTAEGARVAVPQPDGSSRLCLSCHDGTVALGKIAGQHNKIGMIGAERLTPDRPGFIGTDLTGGHPISFVVPDGDAELEVSGRDMGLKSLDSVVAARDVRLDAAGKMQCTTCHDPHSDRYYVPGRVPRFWVRPTVDEVCLTCHELR